MLLKKTGLLLHMLCNKNNYSVEAHVKKNLEFYVHRYVQHISLVSPEEERLCLLHNLIEIDGKVHLMF